MKRKRGFIAAAILIFPVTLYILSRFLLSIAYADLDADGKKELLFISRAWGQEFGNRLVIVSLQKERGQRVQIYDMHELNPWKVQVADADGDGYPELSLGVYKEARLHPVMAKRPFLYNWTGSGISPKWLGSRLSRPFDDYVFCNIDESPEDELIAIETAEDGRKLVQIYRWKGFGFEGLALSRPLQGISRIRRVGGEKVKVKIKEEDQWKWVFISCRDGEVF